MMTKNERIPEFFRNIFRNAYLPFRDPQVLDRFLKQINEFTYDHSEDL
jgi:type I restriction enzyme M protein